MKTVRSIGWYALICLLLVSASEAFGDNTFDILVNDDYSATDQTDPHIAVDKSGNSVVIWTDQRNGQKDIYMQFFDSSGNLLSYNRRMNRDDGTAPQLEPAISGNNINQFAGVWRDYRNGSYPFQPDVYFARVDTVATVDNLNVTAFAPDSTLESPDIAVLESGDFVVVWSDYRNHHWDVFGQRITAAGDYIAGNFKINSDLGSAQHHSPRVAALSDGGFVVVWYDNRNGNDDIYAQRFDADAAPLADNIRIDDDQGVARQAFPAVATDGNGRFFVAWVDWRNGSYPGNPDIYVRRYSAVGYPLEDAIHMYINDGGRPQREAAICSDRMGNLGVVWADSASGQWDVRSQIINSQGERDGEIITVHEETDGKQLQPDIASDGYKFYVTWADYRNGNFDIYASVIRYNDPALIASPGQMEFSMEEGGTLPDAQAALIVNAGYGELNWRAVSNADWLQVSPDSGQTPATLNVTIVNPPGYGTHFGQICLVNLDHQDSSAIIPVQLTVAAPLIDVMPDTLRFRVLAELGDPDTKSFSISNAGSGSFTWELAENATWFEADRMSGNDLDSTAIQISINGLIPGNYIEPAIFTSVDAANSPETVWVALELENNMSCLAATPETVTFTGVEGENLQETIIVSNKGSGTLDWYAETSASWLTLNPVAGSDNDLIELGVTTDGLTSGFYLSEIIITDSASFNRSLVVPVELFLSSGDTVRFMNNNTMPGNIGLIPVFITLSQPARGGYIPIGCDLAVAQMDSIVLNPLSMPPYVEFYGATLSGGAGEIGFRIPDSLPSDSSIRPGNYYIANLFLTAGQTSAFCKIDTLFGDSAGCYVLDTLMQKCVPAIRPGSLIVGTPTNVGDDNRVAVPLQPTLRQNYPNPFNAATTIELYVPQTMNARLEIFNILGQTVAVLVDKPLDKGTYEFAWDGTLKGGSPAPSGIYFYRLSGAEFKTVKKMVLLK